MKLKLLQPGWTGYTGHLGIANFTNGVSDGDVTHETAEGIACTFQCEFVDSSTLADISVDDTTTPLVNEFDQPNDGTT
jgi:hypothetical protein